MQYNKRLLFENLGFIQRSEGVLLDLFHMQM